MSTKSYIKKAIKKVISKNSILWVEKSNWYVGITNNTKVRRSQHESKLGKNLKIFKYWEADSARIAADLEIEFLDTGMKGASGGWSPDSLYIYIYKRTGPLS